MIASNLEHGLLKYSHEIVAKLGIIGKLVVGARWPYLKVKVWFLAKTEILIIIGRTQLIMYDLKGRLPIPHRDNYSIDMVRLSMGRDYY